MKVAEKVQKAIELARDHFTLYPSGREWHVALSDGNLEDHHILDMSYVSGHSPDPSDPDDGNVSTNSRALWQIMKGLSEKARGDVYRGLWDDFYPGANDDPEPVKLPKLATDLSHDELHSLLSRAYDDLNRRQADIENDSIRHESFGRTKSVEQCDAKLGEIARLKGRVTTLRDALKQARSDGTSLELAAWPADKLQAGARGRRARKGAIPPA